MSDDQAMTRIYATIGSKNRLKSAIDGILNRQTGWDLAIGLFKPIHSLFRQVETRTPILRILEETFNPQIKPRPFVILDFSSTSMSEVDALIDSTPIKAHILRIVWPAPEPPC